MTVHTVAENADELAAAAAGRVVVLASAAIASRGVCRLALSGGRTPQGLHRRLASDAWRDRVDWGRVGIWFADERAVPPDHPDSNYRMARDTLLDHVPIGAKSVHRMRGEAEDLAAAAAEYEATLADPLDVVILGLGEDGHFASVFPGSPLVMERLLRAAAVFDAPKPPPRRLTVTPRVIREARSVLTLASGAGKADAVAQALEGDADIRRCPARMLRTYEWFLDRPAAARLRAPTK